MIKTADISSCGNYRYSLRLLRNPSLPTVAFIGLNPSTADDKIDDPTIRRCINYAKDWGCGELIMVNLFAYRATDPKVMKAQDSAAVGEHNLVYLDKAVQKASMTVAAWGSGCPRLHTELYIMADYGPRLHALKLNRNLSPAHPLNQRKDIKPRPFLELMAEAKTA